MTVEQEIELVQNAKNGDHDAFAQLWVENQQKIFKLCCQMTRSREDAEDCTQETFTKAYRKLQTFEGNSRFSSWLGRIAINTALYGARSAKHKLHGALVHPMPAGFDAGDQDREARSRFCHIYLVQAIHELPDRRRSIFVLRALMGLTTAETAKIVGVSIGVVKSTLHRAKVALREQLA